MSEPFHGTPAKNWAHGAASERLREAVEQWQLRRAQQNQGRRNGHQQQMLHHVNREQRIIEGIQWGTNREPHANDSSEKSSKPPERKQLRERGTQAKPASCVNQAGEAQSHIESEGIGPLWQEGGCARSHK